MVISRTRWFPGALIPLVLISSWSCGPSGSTSPTAIRLVDLFESEMVEGSPQQRAAAPAAIWDFSSPPEHPQGEATATQGWQVGQGVSSLKVVDGRLTGRSTSDFPILYAPLPETADRSDALHAIEVRLRISADAKLGAAGQPPGDVNIAQVVNMARAFPWPLSTEVTAGEDFQTFTMQSAMSLPLRAMETVLIRPADVAGARFEIESIRQISQAEHRASIPSGIGWIGLSEIYRETIVTRAPETFSMEVDIPANAWLDLNVGTIEDGPVGFKITASAGGGEQVLLSRTVTTPHRWEPAAVDLASHSGPTKLTFSLDVEKERSIGYWGPVIRVGVPQPQSPETAGAALGGTDPPRGVILIMCDTLRADHLDMYGHERATAPFLAKMASGGALFLDTVSQATWTKVSTPAIMTSLYPSSTGVKDFTDQLPVTATTLAEVYREAGYATVAYSSVLFTGKFTNLHQGFEELHESTSTDDKAYPAKTAREYVDRAVEWIERHPDTPFFMFLHVFDPHDPFLPRAPYDTIWADATKKEHHEQQLEDLRKVIDDPLMKAFGMPTRSEMEKGGVDPAEFVSHDKDWYDGSIRGMDAEVARLIERLRTLGIEKQTQIAFTSDHGEEFIEHGRMFHGQTVYGELAHVPLMLYRPGTVPAGLKIAETVRSIDLMPTLLDLSGLPIPEGIQGQSLVPLMAAVRDAASGGSASEAAQALGWEPRPAVTEKAKTAMAGGPPPRETESYGIVSDNWKLVHNVIRTDDGPEFELYKHADDPLDSANVAEQNPGVVERLKAELASWHEMVKAGKLPDAGQAGDLSPKELERLRSLGYIK